MITLNIYSSKTAQKMKHLYVPLRKNTLNTLNANLEHLLVVPLVSLTLLQYLNIHLI